MAKKVILKKMVNNVIEDVYPRTTAANVIMNSGKTVEETISEIQTSLSALSADWNAAKAKLYLNSIYMTDSQGNVLNDGSGILSDGSSLNLVAIY